MNRIRLSEILNEVADYLFLDKDKIVGHKRSPSLVQARYICYRLSRDLTDFSYPEIAEYFNRDHTGVMWLLSNRKISNQDKEIYYELKNLLLKNNPTINDTAPSSILLDYAEYLEELEAHTLTEEDVRELTKHY